MAFEALISKLDPQQQNTVKAVKSHAERLLNHTPRFKFFTLHGTAHLNNLFEILELLIQGDIRLTADELFLLSLAICIHDLGMVTRLRERDVSRILDGRNASTDPTEVERFIRETHHELVDAYLENDLTFMVGFGVTPNQLAQVAEISKCHRKIVLNRQVGVVKFLGALLRVIDELDLSANRAPIDVFLNIIDEMDPTSCWHWFKHNITEPWMVDHTVSFLNENGRHRIRFKLAVRPTRESSVDYWLTQIRRPINKAIADDGAGAIIAERTGVHLEIVPDREISKVNRLSDAWEQIEETALSAGKKVVLVIDDEFRKLEDLFFPLMDHFHIVQAHNARDAFSKLEAMQVDLAIVDMQIAAGGKWTASETGDFKSTGKNICNEIMTRFSNTKVGILTATRYPISPADVAQIAFLLRKPVDPDKLLEKVQDVLR